MQKQSHLKLITELAVNSKLTLAQVRAGVAADIERQYLRLQLMRHLGDQTSAAKACDVTLGEFRRLMKKNELDPSKFSFGSIANEPRD